MAGDMSLSLLVRVLVLVLLGLTSVISQTESGPYDGPTNISTELQLDGTVQFCLTVLSGTCFGSKHLTSLCEEDNIDFEDIIRRDDKIPNAQNRCCFSARYPNWSGCRCTCLSFQYTFDANNGIINNATCCFLNDMSLQCSDTCGPTGPDDPRIDNTGTDDPRMDNMGTDDPHTDGQSTDNLGWIAMIVVVLLLIPASIIIAYRVYLVCRRNRGGDYDKDPEDPERLATEQHIAEERRPVTEQETEQRPVTEQQRPATEHKKDERSTTEQQEEAVKQRAATEQEAEKEEETTMLAGGMDGVRRRRGGPGGTAPHRDHQIPCSQLPTDGACTTPGLKLSNQPSKINFEVMVKSSAEVFSSPIQVTGRDKAEPSYVVLPGGKEYRVNASEGYCVYASEPPQANREWSASKGYCVGISYASEPSRASWGTSYVYCAADAVVEDSVEVEDTDETTDRDMALVSVETASRHVLPFSLLTNDFIVHTISSPESESNLDVHHETLDTSDNSSDTSDNSSQINISSNFSPPSNVHPCLHSSYLQKTSNNCLVTKSLQNSAPPTEGFVLPQCTSDCILLSLGWKNPTDMTGRCSCDTSVTCYKSVCAHGQSPSHCDATSQLPQKYSCEHLLQDWQKYYPVQAWQHLFQNWQKYYPVQASFKIATPFKPGSKIGKSTTLFQPGKSSVSFEIGLTGICIKIGKSTPRGIENTVVRGCCDGIEFLCKSVCEVNEISSLCDVWSRQPYEHG